MPLERALSADEGSSRMSAAMRSAGADLTRSGHCADILQNLRILCVDVDQLVQDDPHLLSGCGWQVSRLCFR